MILGHVRGSKLSREILQDRTMLPQPWIALDCRADYRFERLGRALQGFTRDEPGPTLDDQRFWHGTRPVAPMDRSDVDRRPVVESGIEWVRDGIMMLALVPKDCFV